MVEDILSGLKHYIFADSENDANSIPSFVDYLSIHNYISVDSQIICIIGADKSQNEYYEKLKIAVNKIAKQTAYNLTPIRIEDTGRDALDKVLIAYTGMAVEKSQNAKFIIISSDGGYSPVINRLMNIGVDIKVQKLSESKKVNAKTKKQEKSNKTKTPAQKSKPAKNSSVSKKEPSADKIKTIAEKIYAQKSSRPAKAATLRNKVLQLKTKYKMTDKEIESAVKSVQDYLMKTEKLVIRDGACTWK